MVWSQHDLSLPLEGLKAPMNPDGSFHCQSNGSIMPDGGPTMAGKKSNDVIVAPSGTAQP